MRAPAALLCVGWLGLAAAAHAAQQPAAPRAGEAAATRTHGATVPRDGIDALERQLDRAIDRVSLPRPVALLGREAARGYRLPGYGVVFVLTPRTLPGPGGLELLHRRQRRPLPPVRVDAETPQPPDEVDALEHQVVVLQHETEQARRAAEEDMERIVHDVRLRLATPGELRVEVTAAPQPAEGPVAAATPAPPVAPAAPATPLPAEAPLPPPPPWKFWFQEAEARDTRTAEAVVADVRRALVEALDSGPGRVPGLRPEEFVTVAVDFEPAGLFAQHPRPERTLLVRARVRDLEARARGSIAAEELRRRVEVIEY
jgi:hypothetical protein